MSKTIWGLVLVVLGAACVVYNTPCSDSPDGGGPACTEDAGTGGGDGGGK